MEEGAEKNMYCENVVSLWAPNDKLSHAELATLECNCDAVEAVGWSV